MKNELKIKKVWFKEGSAWVVIMELISDSKSMRHEIEMQKQKLKTLLK